MRKNKRYKVLAEVRLNKPRWEASRHNQHQKDQFTISHWASVWERSFRPQVIENMYANQGITELTSLFSSFKSVCNEIRSWTT